MTPLFRAFLDLCLLRAGPQQLPASPFLLGLALAAYALTGLPLLLLEFDLPAAAGQVALDVALLAATARLLLAARRRAERFTQTYTALTGSGTLLNLAALPILLGLYGAEAAGGGAGLFSLLWMGLFVWSLLVSGAIYHHALDLPLPAGIGVALGYLLLILALNAQLFPSGSPS